MPRSAQIVPKTRAIPLLILCVAVASEVVAQTVEIGGRWRAVLW